MTRLAQDKMTSLKDAVSGALSNKKRALTAAAALGGAAAIFGAANAADYAVDGGISMVAAKSAVAEEVHIFHNWVLMPIMTGISLFVLALLLWVIVRYNSKANPVARKFSHNTLVEVLWTGIPIIILLFIALFSFDLLYKEDVTPDGKQVVAQGGASEYAFANDFTERRVVKRPDHIEVFLSGASGVRKLENRKDYKLDGLGDPEVLVTLTSPAPAGDEVIIRGGRSRVGPTKIFGLFGEDKSKIAMAPTLTLKVIGFQWGWTYAYPDFGDFEFNALMLEEDQTTPEKYRLAVDNPVVVPVGETIRVITAARDVIHSWALPNFAIKIDAVPGRLNETWFSAEEEGVYYGQCSEICGIKHSFMPIEVHAVSRPEFMKWVNEQRELNGMEPIAAGPAGGEAKTRTAALENK